MCHLTAKIRLVRAGMVCRGSRNRLLQVATCPHSSDAPEGQFGGKNMQATHNETPMMMKPAEAARLADCSTRTITRMCEAGVLDAAKFGSSWRLNRASFMRRIGAAE